MYMQRITFGAFQCPQMRVLLQHDSRLAMPTVENAASLWRETQLCPFSIQFFPPTDAENPQVNR
jgi:hypothetical protein